MMRPLAMCTMLVMVGCGADPAPAPLCEFLSAPWSQMREADSFDGGQTRTQVDVVTAFPGFTFAPIDVVGFPRAAGSVSVYTGRRPGPPGGYVAFAVAGQIACEARFETCTDGTSSGLRGSQCGFEDWNGLRRVYIEPRSGTVTREAVGERQRVTVDALWSVEGMAGGSVTRGVVRVRVTSLQTLRAQP